MLRPWNACNIAIRSELAQREAAQLGQRLAIPVRPTSRRRFDAVGERKAVA
jgi:hypothetical protein